MNAKYTITTLSVLATLAVGSPDPGAAAAGTADWLLTLAPTPIGRLEHAMAYDSVRDRVVLFGGYYHCCPVLRDTWEWDGSAWLKRTPATSPSARGGHAMAYDSARGRVVLFGGSEEWTFFADTWEWDGSTWIERTPATSPPARSYAAMVYDVARGRMVLFGGWRDDDDLSDTWEWDGNNWSQRTPATSPPVRSNHAMAYDIARGRVVLFGGISDGLWRNDTWEWDGNTWLQRAPTTSPSARRDHAMAYDSNRSRVVLYGGYNYDRPGDTWEWTGNTWVQRTPAASPVARWSHAMVYDDARGRVVVFGGELNGQFVSSEIWEWDGSAWVERERTSGPSQRAASSVAYDIGRGRLVLFGGVQNDLYLGLDDTWELDGSTWIQRSTATRPPARHGHAMSYDAARRRVVLFGGYPLGHVPSPLSDTWEWDGSTWSQRTPPTSPPARAGHAMAYDDARGRVVLFGGLRLADTWEWDGNDWVERMPATSPPAREGHVMAYDSGRGRLVLFGGGDDSGVLADTWEWDGSSWVERTPGTSPPGRSGGAMVYDVARGRTVLFGGFGDGSRLGDTWEWDGTGWIEPVLPTIVPSRYGHSMAYDHARGRVILFGGAGREGTFDDMWEYGPIDDCGHAASVVSFTRGSGTGDMSALGALGAADGVGVSLGLDGSLELRIDPPIPNGSGADLIVHEIGSLHGGLDDGFRVEVSEDRVSYLSAGECSGDDCQLDIGGSGVSRARYVRLLDLPPDDGEPAPDAGADIDAVSLVACNACDLLEGPDFDGDGLANACDDCPEHANSTQTDTDGDGAGDACDCAPTDPLARPAEEVAGLAVEKLGAGGLRLSWSPAAGAAAYAVIRADFSVLSATELGDCVVGGVAALAWDDAELPPPGDGFTYLVRGESPVCGQGTLGFGAFGLPRIDTGSACPG